MSHYCDIAPGNPFHGPYHEGEYGFPSVDDSVLFERLTLEIFQAGLSWLIVLKKRTGIKNAFRNFDVEQVARFVDHDCERLKENASIIRNRLKIKATVHNAKVIFDMRLSHGGFANWLTQHHPLTKKQWCKLFKSTFMYTGSSIVGEFLMSTAYLKGAHRKNCPVFNKVLKERPPWFILEE
jgi:DNA-3-methyladenine glycosylase I